MSDTKVTTHHHHRAEPVDEEAHVDRPALAREPGVERAGEGMPRRHLAQAARGRRRSEIATEAIVTVCAKVRPSFQPRRPASDRPRERGEGGDAGRSSSAPSAPHPLRDPRSSTSIDLRLRKSVTRIASPMADSAAATVRMKNTNTCPDGVAAGNARTR